MQDLYRSRVERSSRAIKNWWLLLLLGIATFIVGVFIFTYPGESYLAMSVAFGVLMLASGLVNIVLAASTDNIVIGRGWLLASGIIELILGFILVMNVHISAMVLPLILGFWLMIRSFGMIGTGSDLMSAKVSGGSWTVFVGVLLLICSVMILVQPIWFGVEAVVIWVGISFLMGGIAMSVFAFQLKRLHNHFTPKS